MSEEGPSRHPGIDIRTRPDLYALIDLEREIGGLRAELARSIGFSEGVRTEREYKVSRNRVYIMAIAIIVSFVMSAISLYFSLTP